MTYHPEDADNKVTDTQRLLEAASWRTYLTENRRESTPEFDAWLEQDSKNRRAWSLVQSSWNIFGEQADSPALLELRRGALERARSAPGPRWTRWLTVQNRRGWMAAAGVLLAALAVSFGWNVKATHVYRTNAGERRQITLADGSTVQLDSATELRVRYSDRQRELTLNQGQARFEVAHDSKRPFSVLAGGRKVVATGTEFNVDLLGPKLFVTLIEGHVIVLSEEARRKQASSRTDAAYIPAEAREEKTEGKGSAKNSDPIELTAGEQLAVSASGVASVSRSDVQHATAWQSGQLVFDNEALSSVVERVNRYATRPLVLADDQTADLKISGVFHTGDVDGFVSTITHYLPIEADVTARNVRLSHR